MNSMSATSASSADVVSEPESRLISIQRNQLFILAVLLSLAFAPLWWTYFAWTWQDGHYQYFPLLIAAVVGLYYTRLSQASERSTAPTKWIVLAGSAVVVIGLLVGHLMFSGFVGIVTTILTAWLLTYACFGWGGVKVMAPVLSLMVLAIPLPLNWDTTLIFKMQFLASQLASWLLDGAGVMHVRQGVVLITEKSQYMTEEACSGVRSLFSSLAVVAVYAVVSEHRTARTVLNLIQTVFWVLLGNAVRVAACVYLADNVSTWYASGAGHEALSMVVFAFILAMVISTDQIISWFAVRKLHLNWSDDASLEIVDEVGQMSETRRGIFGWGRGRGRSDVPQDIVDDVVANKVSKATAGLLGKRKQRRPYVEMGDGDVDEMAEAKSSAALIGRQRRDSMSMGDEPMEPSASGYKVSTRAALGLGAMLLVVAIFGGIAVSRQGASVMAPDALPPASAEFLPENLNGWTRVKYEFIQRDQDRLLAPESYTWTYRRDGLFAIISLDCPWNEWHNLNNCYSAVGWETEPNFFVESPAEAPYSQLTYSDLRMTKPDNRSGYVLFTVVDRNREDVRTFDWRGRFSSIGEFFSGVTTQIKKSLGMGELSAQTLPATTIQMYSEHRGPYTDADRAALQEFFFAARKELLESPRWAK